LSGKFKWEATYLAESTRAIRRLEGRRLEYRTKAFRCFRHLAIGNGHYCSGSCAEHLRVSRIGA